MKLSKLVIASFCLIGIASCTKLPNTSQLSSNFFVATQYSPEADFQEYVTYYVPDSIFVASDDKDDPTSISDVKAAQVLARVRYNLNSAGYIETTRDSADIGVPVTLFKSTSSYSSGYYPGYWWGYPGYPGGGYWGCPGCGYWYPWYGGTYSYTTGTLIMEFFDIKNSSSEQIQVVWNSVMGDVYNTAQPVNEAIKAVDQSFNQSPYIKSAN